MPVDTEHPQYRANRQAWQKMRDVIGGSRCVKHAGEAYLPRITDQSDDEYRAYVARAKFFGATGKTLDALDGFIFRKKADIKAPDNLADFMKDATLQGVSWYDYCRDSVDDILAVGRRGTLIDFEGEEEKRAYVIAYDAESIINWKTDRIYGRQTLTMVVLYESSEEYLEEPTAEMMTLPGTGPTQGIGAMPANAPEKPDKFSQTTFSQWRVYELLDDGAGEYYVQCTVWRKKEKGAKIDEFYIVEQTIPARRGIPLNKIPFVFSGSQNSLPEVNSIPLEDLADVNLDHYRTSADLQNGRHFTGLPVPYAIGFETNNLKIGSSVAWVAENPQASCGYLEFKGTGLGSLETAIEEDERYMAALGAKMLEPQAKKAEAFDTVAIRAAAETSALAFITNSASESLSCVLEWVSWWMGTLEDPKDYDDLANVVFSTDFVSGAVPADLLTAMVAALQGGAMDLETIFWNLQRCEMIADDVEFATFKANIDQQAQDRMALMPPEPAPAPVPAK